MALCGCDVILPPPNPLEETRLLPDAYAWKSLDILEEYEYMHLSELICKEHYPILGCIGISRRQSLAPVTTPGTFRHKIPSWLRKACPKIRFGVTALGICHPAFTDVARLECPRLSTLLTSLNLCQSVDVDTTRINCPKVSSVLTASGVCKPIKTPAGAMVRCPLVPPFDTFDFGCLTSDDTPAVYMRFTMLDEAKDIAIPENMGTCTVEAAGPAIGEPQRYSTDEGYKVCLLSGSDKVPAGALSSTDAQARPIGLYLDYSETHVDINQIKTMADKNAFSGNFSLVLDTVYFDAEQRKHAFEAIRDIFWFYRQISPDNPEENTSSDEQR